MAEVNINLVLPDSPIDVASMLINSKVKLDINQESLLYSVYHGEDDLFLVPRYDISELEEIAEHLLIYCDAQRRGVEDVTAGEY